MSYIVSIDLGGTKTVVSLVETSISTKIVKRIKYLTHANKGKRYVLSQMIKYTNLMMQGVQKNKVVGIGIAVPSTVDTKRGIVLFPPNLKGWKNVPLKKILEKRFKMPVAIENDSKLAGLGEYTVYGTNTLFCLMLGTGVGGGLIINGYIYNGINSAVEIGHMIIDATSNVKCSCGNMGCFESYVSGRAIAKRYKELKKTKKEMTAKDVADLAAKKDRLAKQILKQASDYLSVGITNIINIFEPDTLVISGGVSNIKNDMVLPAIDKARKNTLVKYDGNIVISDLGSDAILLGADFLVKHEYLIRPFKK